MKQPAVRVGEVYEAPNGTKFTVLSVVMDRFHGDYAVTVNRHDGSGRPLGDGAWFLQETIVNLCELVPPTDPEWVVLSPDGTLMTTHAAAANDALLQVVRLMGLSPESINDEDWVVDPVPTDDLP